MNVQSKTVGDILDELSPNIAQRINAVMGEVDYIQKEKKDGMKYTIVSHDKVTGLVRPILHKHGVVYYPRELTVKQDGNRTEAVFAVRFENINNRADYIDVATFGYGVDPQDKGPGKAMSYGVKYALLKLLGLETGDDPDEEQGLKADHVPEAITAGEPKPRAREKLEGTYTSHSVLQRMLRQFIHDLNGMGDLSEFIVWGQSTDVQDLLKQAKRDESGWYYGGDTMPKEWVPIQVLIADKKRELEQLEGIKNRGL